MGVSGGRIGDQAAGKSLHGDKAHIGFFAGRNQFLLFGGGKIAERKLKGFIKPAFNHLHGNSQLMVRDADVANFSCRFGGQSRLIKSASIPRPGAEGRIVELVNINVVCAEHGKTFL